MKRQEACVLTNMCMVYDGNRILVQDRKDPNWPGITFPGGHVERGESFVDSVIREVHEETGLCIERVQLCGIKQWSDTSGEFRYIVLFYKTNVFSGELTPSSEGEVFWIDKGDLGNYQLADGFDTMIDIFLNEDVSENYWWCEGGRWFTENK